MTKLEVFTDGAARGNPGESASGYSVYREGRLIREDVWYNGRKTNNYAEYRAAIGALKWCSDNFDAASTDLTLFSDSQLLVNQANGTYKVRSESMKELRRELSALVKTFRSAIFRNVPRSNSLITRVDRRLNLFLDRRGQ